MTLSYARFAQFFLLVASACFFGPSYSQNLQPAYGLPDDFPPMFDQADKGMGEDIKKISVGGMEDQRTTRQNISKAPVILIHGNLGSALHPKYGWSDFIRHLYEAGYTKAEVWAVSYLGYTEATPDWLRYMNMAANYNANINEIRDFIDKVRDYTGCDKIDLIGHSLGGGEARGYLYGLDTSDVINPTLSRFDNVGTLVTIAAGNYGLGPLAFTGAFSSEWADTHFNENPEPTPAGHAVAAQLITDAQGKRYKEYDDWKEETKNDTAKMRYVAIISDGDAVDMLGGTDRVSRLEGANLNYIYKSGKDPAEAHLEAIKDREIINVLAGDKVITGGYLNAEGCEPTGATTYSIPPGSKMPIRSVEPQE